MVEQLFFRNDGVVDVLTLTIAPNIFLANLNREFSRADRELRDVGVIWIAIEIQNPKDETEIESVVAVEELLVEIAFQLKQLLRSEEFFSRIYETGFWCFLSGSSISAESAIARISTHLNNELAPRLKISHLNLICGYLIRESREKVQDFLNRLDQVFVSTKPVPLTPSPFQP